MTEPESRAEPGSRGGVRAENSVRPSKTPRKDSGARPQAAVQRASISSSKPTQPDSVPEEIRKRFVQVKNRFYFPDGARAFTDRGNRLTTASENTEVIRSLIVIAQARGWSEITVRGTERFRKEAWFVARSAGLNVRGYQSSEFEQSHLIRTLSRERSALSNEAAPAPADARQQPDVEARNQERRGGLLTGRLADHGRATYRHDPREPMSYFVKLETPRGSRVIWGVDLERAFKESLSKPQVGDEVGLRAVRQDAVKVRAHKRDDLGDVIERDVETHRNRWILEKRAFFDSRTETARTVRDASVNPKQAVQRHPELVGTYLQIRAAELAAKQFRDPQDRELFVAKVRSALADSVARGEALPPVRLRERAAERAPKSQVPQVALVRS
jgi:conjugative element/phage-associated large polyvalent protein